LARQPCRAENAQRIFPKSVGRYYAEPPGVEVRYSPNMVQEALSLPVPGQSVDRKIPPLSGDGPGQVRVDLPPRRLWQGNLRTGCHPDCMTATYPVSAEGHQTFGQTGLA
jgi:hypothetical protein